MDETLERRAIAKVTWRLVPFLIICYFVAYLDRVNVGFAALTMNKALGFSPSVFGFGAGIFFFGYFIFEVPSNYALATFGARRWIARIMITWGVLSGAMAFIWNDTSFYVVRVLLGLAEAGFFPGIIFYLTLWFPSVYRARIIGYFMAAIPMSTVIGAPLSSFILDSADGAFGLQGWQWLFIVEAVPALILAGVVLFYLTDLPSQANWLAPDEREWLVDRLAAERAQREAAEHFSFWQALRDMRVLALALVYFGMVATNYGLGFWLPQIVKNFGLTIIETGLVTMIPYLVGAVSMVWWGRNSDRRMERKWHAALAALVAALGIGLSTVFGDPVLKVICLSVAAAGVFGVLPVFWTLPTAFLSGTAAAGGIALINALGNLSGFGAPFAMGLIKEATGSFDGGLLLIAALAIVSMALILILGHNPALEKVPERASAAAE
jgi:D-galactonate transporter